MDEKDLQILQLLEENSRIPTADLATMTELSEDDVRARIAGMEDARIIRGYSTVVDWERAGNGEVLAIIDLKVTPERDFGYERIAERIARFHQVRALRLVTGMYDLQLLVAGRTMQEVARFVSEQIAPMDHIRETATHLIMKIYKENGTLFVEREGAERLPFSF
ncbi:MAG: Lrp/AsnC family transcriptional regulator [Methanomicrobiales archaeon]|nr:Lrp/AsnC family transcriptional regulator [Methanomicrobiales archaeon]MDD1656859.1 Lrp/AsnC family transcriptional regulator [Methanomicrobiales archaeon]